MLLLNYFPIIYAASGIFTVYHAPFNRFLAALLWIYILPPLIGRITILIFGRPEKRASGVFTGTYRLWWFLLQLQVPFDRFRFLEEILRLVPGLYNFWLNLWGAKVHLFTYWSAGSLISDRYNLEIEKFVVMGGHSGIGGHVITKTKSGEYVLTAAKVKIGKGSIIGARASIGPGSIIPENSVVPAGSLLLPFTKWKN